MIKKIFAAALSLLVVTITFVGCTTSVSMPNEDNGNANYSYMAKDEQYLYVPVNNKAAEIIEESYNLNVQANTITVVTPTSSFSYTFSDKIKELRKISGSSSYGYVTNNNEVGTFTVSEYDIVCNQIESGNDGVVRKLFYPNESNQVEYISENNNYLIYYENNKLKGANSNNYFYFDDLPYEEIFIFTALGPAVGKGNGDCYFASICGDLERGATVEEMLSASRISY